MNEKGIPTPLAATMLRAPQSRMDILTDSEIATINANSKLVKKYAEEIDRESAYEIVTKKLEEAAQVAEEVVQEEKEVEKGPSTAEVIGKSVTKVVTSASFIRGVFGILMKLFRK